MRKSPRHDHILATVAACEEATVEALASACHVSLMTIRRDLAELEALGKLHRTHGGAVAAAAGTIEFAFQEKSAQQAEEKRAIAREIASRIHAGMAVSLDTGTTTLEVARCLLGVKGITVLTTSLATASVLYAAPDIQLVLLGGVVGKRTPNLYGDLTEENLKRFCAHLAVLGADAVTPDGVFTTEVSIARVSRAMIAKADRVILAVDHSKFSSTAFVKCVELDCIDEIVTDDRCPRDVRRRLRQGSVQVTYAPVEAD